MSRLALFAVAVALASPGAAPARSADIVRTYAGITCTWPANLSAGAVLCWRADGVGVVAGVAKQFVLVRTRAGRILFFHRQPSQSRAPQPLDDKRFFHTETHGGIRCAWARLVGGAARCGRDDEYGYSFIITRPGVVVFDGQSRPVYQRNQK